MVQEVPDGSNLFVEVRRRFLSLEASRELLQHARTSSGGKQRRRVAALHMTAVNRLCGGKRKERQEAAGWAGTWRSSSQVCAPGTMYRAPTNARGRPEGRRYDVKGVKARVTAKAKTTAKARAAAEAKREVR